MEIGTRLREARQAKNLSLDEIQKITKIQTRYLQAIEKGNFNVMPGNFYVRAFVKEYAAAVDLDPDQLMEEYKAELPASSDESAIQYSRVQRSRKESSTSKSPAIFSFLPTIIVVLLIVGTIFAVWYFYQKSLSGDQDEPINQIENGGDEVRLPQEDEQLDNETIEGDEEQNQPPIEDEEDIQPEEDTNQQPALTIVEQGNNDTTYDLTNPGETLKINFTTTDRNWLEVENGLGKSFVYETLTTDSSPLEIDMTGEEQVYLKFGNPGSITITINGVPLQLPEDTDLRQVQEVWVNIIKDTE